MKLSKRDRYILKWNGPECMIRRKKNRHYARANMGRGDACNRIVSTAYECRFKGFYPATDAEMCLLAGVPLTIAFSAVEKAGGGA